MAKKMLLAAVLVIAGISLSASEGTFQLNTIFQHTTYSLFGTGGKDIIRLSSAGIGLKSTRGNGFQGTIDIALLFPYNMEEKIYPASSFSQRVISGFPIALDSVIGMGYMFNLSPMMFLVSGGFHTGALLEGGAFLVSFGLGADAQVFVKYGKVLTAQIGLKFAVDFWGTQTFVPGSNQFFGFPLTFGIYTGLGLKY
ncbi:MAG: hypothetical protein DRP60_08515 [Spirochaetes bacterium]|nr:MAG: hypothetical protein DRP60_08515 [Spirochaetota bacterium]